MAKAQTLDEMIDSGVLTDYTNRRNDIIERELEQVNLKDSVDDELEKLKTERAKIRKDLW